MNGPSSDATTTGSRLTLCAGVLIISVLSAGCDTAPPQPKPRAAAKAIASSKQQPAKSDRKSALGAKRSSQRPASTKTSAKATGRAESSGGAAALSKKAAAERTRLIERESSERLLFLTAGGPLIVQVLIVIDGAPYGLERTKKVDALLKLLPEQAAPHTWLSAFASPEFALALLDEEEIEGRRQLQLLRQWDEDADGLMDRMELLSVLARAEDDAFTLDAESGAGYREVETRLWGMLDTDQSLHLTSEELLSAPELLKSLDADDNDLVDAAEIDLPSSTQPGMAASMDDETTGPRLVHLLGANANWSAIRYALQELYQYEGAIQSQHFPLAPGLVAQLDADQDGEFDLEESVGLNVVPPHIELEAHFPAVPGKPGLSVRTVSADLGSSDRQVTQSAGGVDIALPVAKLKIAWNDAAEDAQQMAVQQFAMLDADKNGYLEKAEAGSPGGPLADNFEAADKSADGKVYAEEFTEYLVQQQAPERRRVQAVIDGKSDAAFSVLDSNGDGRLSARDMLRSPDLLMAWDQNADGEVATSEMPLVLTLSLNRGASLPAGQTVATPPIAPSASPPPDAPRWYVAMDGNGDGDISRREFLGPSPLFDRLDLNQDGFVDLPEAGQSVPLDDPPAPNPADTTP